MLLKTYSLEPDFTEDLSQDAFPSSFRTWQGNQLQLPSNGTHFGYVHGGHPCLSRYNGTEAYTLHPGMYFCLPGEGRLDGRSSSGLVITLANHQGMFSIGGPIEASGRFAYINGGTNTLLIPPARLGDPCLNALYFPPGVDQTLHTHPSYRLGIVIEGNGECETLEGSFTFKPGIVFLIPASVLHKFRTLEEKLTLVIFHPDSDTGFTHQNNPMLNRTLIEGVSAAHLPQIKTKYADSPDGT